MVTHDAECDGVAPVRSRACFHLGADPQGLIEALAHPDTMRNLRPVIEELARLEQVQSRRVLLSIVPHGVRRVVQQPSIHAMQIRAEPEDLPRHRTRGWAERRRRRRRHVGQLQAATGRRGLCHWRLREATLHDGRGHRHRHRHRLTVHGEATGRGHHGLSLRREVSRLRGGRIHRGTSIWRDGLLHGRSARSAEDQWWCGLRIGYGHHTPAAFSGETIHGHGCLRLWLRLRHHHRIPPTSNRAALVPLIIWRSRNLGVVRPEGHAHGSIPSTRTREGVVPTAGATTPTLSPKIGRIERVRA